jgi:hypothetical protein
MDFIEGDRQERGSSTGTGGMGEKASIRRFQTQVPDFE